MEIACLVDSRSIRTASRIYRETFSKFPLLPHGLRGVVSRVSYDYAGDYEDGHDDGLSTLEGKGWGGAEPGFNLKLGERVGISMYKMRMLNFSHPCGSRTSPSVRLRVPQTSLGSWKNGQRGRPTSVLDVSPGRNQQV